MDGNVGLELHISMSEYACVGVCVCESAIIVDTLMFCALIILLVPNYLRVSPIADPASLWLLRL